MGRRCPRRLLLLTDVPMLLPEKWRRPDPFLTLLSVERDRLRLNLARPEMLSTRWPPSTLELLVRSAALREPSIHSMLRLMTCFTRPRTLRRRPRRPWLMLLVLLMNSELSRTMSALSPRPRELLRHSSLSLRLSLETPSLIPLRA